LNQQGFEPGMYLLPLLARTNYGWFQHVSPADAEDREAIARFYRRHGAHLALLYLLGGYDSFSENVLAQGEYPVLVDLECVHSPMLPALHALFDSAARRYLEESVYRTGLLPAWSWAYLGGPGVNLSALTNTEGQLTPQEVPEWTDLGLATLHQKRARRVIHSQRSHLPTLRGIPQPVDEFMDDLYKGFTEAYRAIRAGKQELLSSPSSPLSAFANVDCRLVLRNTSDYAVILGEGRHPRYFSDALRYSVLIDRLWVSRCPRFSARVINSETSQLLRGDVPLFTTRGDSTHLYDDAGRIVQRDYFAESALDGAKRRLARWNTDDCDLQLEIMNCAFSITEQPHVTGSTVTIPLDASASESENRGLQLNTDTLVAEAVHIAERLLAVAIEDERTLTWLGLGANREGQWQQDSLDSSFYDGGPGVAMLFLYVHALTGEGRFLDAYSKILQYAAIDAAKEVLATRARLNEWVLEAPRGMDFPCSALYLCIQARAFRPVPELDLVLEATLAWNAVGLERKPRFDFLSGAAGVIRALLVAYRALGDARCLSIARRYGKLIVDHAIPINGGLAWPSDPYPRPLGGFSHGASGIAWVLADLAELDDNEEFRRAALGALAFDRSLFSAEREIWFDRRHPDEYPGGGSHWCHGVAGIALGRMLFSSCVKAVDLSQDIARAVEIMLGSEQHSDCLCHGELGNFEICTLAAETFSNRVWQERTIERMQRVWTAAQSRGFWRSGLPAKTIGVCGLFMGTAGIGYELLKAAYPTIVPSVLYLEEPKPDARRLSNAVRLGTQPHELAASVL
jgi:type 2 lantibiotic biosynthesis protein LanM